MKINFTKLLTLLGVFLFLGAGNASAWKVFYTNPDGKSTVKVYVWNNSTNNGWPGTTMTKNNLNGLYEADLNFVPTGIQFNDGTNSYQKEPGVNSAKLNVFKNDWQWEMPSTLYLIGKVNSTDWNTNSNDLPSASNNNGVFTFKNVRIDDGNEFSIITKKGNGWETVNSGDRYGPSVAGQTISTTTSGTVIPHVAEVNAGNAKNWKLAAGYYNIEVDLNNWTIKASSTEPEFYIAGDKTDWLNNKVKMNHTPGTNVWTYTSNSVFQGEWKICDGTWNVSFGSFQDEDWEKKKNVVPLAANINNDTKFKGENFGGIDGNVTVTFTLVEGSDNANSTTYSQVKFNVIPNELYLYGHIKNKAWEFDNGIKMTNEGNGKFTVTDVNVSGIWNEADAGFGHNKGEHTDGENYIAFFTQPVNDRAYFGSAVYKFGAMKENTEVDKKEGSTNRLTNSNYNFMVADGYYDIEVDFNAGTVKFIRNENYTDEGKYKISYDWHDGNGDMMDYDSNDIQQFIQGQENIVQVGVNGADDHWAATSAVFTVYKSANARSLKGKRKVNDSDYTVKATQGTDYLILNNDNNEVDDHNSNVNNKIQLLSSGEYKIVADLPNDTKAYDYYAVEPVTMYASVAAVQGSSTDNTAEFNPQSNTYTIENAFALSSNKVDDVQVTIEQGSETDSQNWIVNPSSELSAGYEAVLPDDLYVQYTTLNAAIVDGFYKPVDNIQLSVSDEADDQGYYNYTITANFYCSGVYNLTIKPADNATTEFNEIDGTITITPNLLGTYGSGETADNGFNINGYTFEGGTITLPEKIVDKGVGIGYIPGIYLVSSFETNKPYSKPENVNEKRAKSEAPYAIQIDLSTLSSSDNLTVTVVKNGATGTANFKIETGSGGKESTTGVDAVGVEDGEAVYYNLQGVRVENPQHGIFVKVVNGKATKVVL